MYFYFYDTFVNSNKYQTILSKIEIRLIDLGIHGKREHCSLLKNADELIRDGIKKGADNIIAVGNDETLIKVIHIVANYNVTVGFIPVVESKFAKILGIPLGDKACDVLSRRIVEKVDLGKINNHYFFMSLRIPRKQILLECEGKYNVRIENECKKITLCNLGEISHKTDKKDVIRQEVHNITDGFLEVVIEHAPSKNSWFSRIVSQKNKEKKTILPIKKAKIISEVETADIIADEDVVVKTPALVEIAPHTLPIIVGKDRMF